jgi:uncharacterized membrane protein YfcA
MEQYAAVCLIFFAASFTQGVSGFGSALVAMPTLVWFMDAKTAVPLCSLNGLVITGFLSWRMRNHLEWRKILPLCIGCLPGIYVGVTFLVQANDRLIRVLLGLLVAGYAFYRMVIPPRTLRVPGFWAYLAGFATGVIGGAFSAGGPPTIIYTTLAGWSKDSIKATLSGFFLVTGMFVAFSHAVKGVTTAEVLSFFSLSVLCTLAGVYAGALSYDRVDQVLYLRIIHVALIALGVLLVISSLV